MKITGFRQETYLMRMDRPVGDANMPEGVDIMPGSILYIDTDENITGIGLGFAGPSVGMLFQAIEGADPREATGLWMRMNDLLHKAGNRGEASLSLSNIDFALWDLKAKLAGEPVWRLLGARAGRVKAYASGLDYCLSDDQVFDFYRRMALLGIDSGKLKVGLDLQADIRRIGIMREALSVASPNPGLMIDANEYWSAKQAIRWIRAMEGEFDLQAVEEPARRWDYGGLRQVSQQVNAAVATGENLTSVTDFYPLIANGAVDIVSVSPFQSGLTGVRQIADMAAVHGLAVSMMNCQANFMAHVAAAMTNHTTMEVIGVNREHCLRFNNRIEEGYIVLDESPGFGIEVDEAKLAQLKANPPQGTRRFPFPRREGAGRYIVPPREKEVPW